jgi:hypothetical protein
MKLVKVSDYYIDVDRIIFAAYGIDPAIAGNAILLVHFEDGSQLPIEQPHADTLRGYLDKMSTNLDAPRPAAGPFVGGPSRGPTNMLNQPPETR